MIDLVCFVQYLWWSDPFLEFFKLTETGWQLAHRTEVQTLNQQLIFFYPLNYYYHYFILMVHCYLVM